MSTISLCMIVKNEEPVLARCLDSVAGIADEIVIVDTGSTDATKAIAAQYTDKVFDFPWIDDFAAARNESFRHAAMDYCMWLDADDVLEEGARAELLRIKTELLPGSDMVMMKYHTGFHEDGTPLLSYYRERIVRNSPRFRWVGAIHECIPPAGEVAYSEGAVTHRKSGPGDPDRNLRIFEGLLAKGRNLDPREQFYYGRELYYHKRYADAAQVLERFLSQGWGWYNNNIDACRTLAECYDALGKSRLALRALLESFSYDAPRAEVCCDLGARFLAREEYQRAAYWYELALTCPRNDQSGAFVSPDCYGYLPCIQLCVCWYRLGEPEKARAYNDRAGRYKPQDPAYLYNKKFFELP